MSAAASDLIRSRVMPQHHRSERRCLWPAICAGVAGCRSDERVLRRTRPHGHERLLKKTNGTIRFDLEHDHEIDHWLVAISKGDVQVSREKRDADSVIRSDNAFFDRMVRRRGQTVAGVAAERDHERRRNFGSSSCWSGSFAPPPGARHPRVFARDAGGGDEE